MACAVSCWSRLLPSGHASAVCCGRVLELHLGAHRAGSSRQQAVPSGMPVAVACRRVANEPSPTAYTIPSVCFLFQDTPSLLLIDAAEARAELHYAESSDNLWSGTSQRRAGPRSMPASEVAGPGARQSGGAPVVACGSFAGWSFSETGGRNVQPPVDPAVVREAVGSCLPRDRPRACHPGPWRASAAGG